MKRTGPLPRRTELPRGGPLPRLGLQRRPRAPRRPTVRTRTPDVIAETIARRLVAVRSGGVCEVCGNARATNWHHRKNAGQGGAWSASNGLHVCGSGTTGCHGAITCSPWSIQARPRGFTVHAGPGNDPAEIPVDHVVHGWVLLLHDGGVQPVDPPPAGDG